MDIQYNRLGWGTSTNTGSGSDPPEIQTDPDPSLDIKKTWTPPLKNNPDMNLISKKSSSREIFSSHPGPTFFQIHIWIRGFFSHADLDLDVTKNLDEVRSISGLFFKGRIHFVVVVYE